VKAHPSIAVMMLMSSHPLSSAGLAGLLDGSQRTAFGLASLALYPAVFFFSAFLIAVGDVETNGIRGGSYKGILCGV